MEAGCDRPAQVEFQVIERSGGRPLIELPMRRLDHVDLATLVQERTITTVARLQSEVSAARRRRRRGDEGGVEGRRVE